MPESTASGSGISGLGKRIRTPVATLGLTLLLLVLLSVVSGLLVWQDHRETMRSNETRAQNAAQVVAAHIQWLFEASFQALRRVDEALGERPDLFIAGTPGDLGKAVEALPSEIAIWAFDSKGVALLTDAAPAPVADQLYFQALQAGAPWYVSPLLPDNVTGRKAFAIAHRIERNGEFLGAAVIFVPAGLMADFWATLDLGPNSSVGLLRDDGWLIARHPVPDDTMNLGDQKLFTDFLPNAPSGAYSSSASPADGVGRIVGYYRVPGLPVIAVAGLSSDAAMTRFWRRIELAGVLAVPIVGALILALLWVSRLLRRDEMTRAELAQALDRNRVLFREIHHRVKNNLQTVSSLLKLQPGPAEAKDEMGRRIAAMSAVHEHIYLSDQFSRVDLGEYIRRLVHNLDDSLGASVTVNCDLEPLHAEADQVLPLGLIINEVVTNAFKHAFPDGRGGTITVMLYLLDDGRVCLRVTDDGVGYGGEGEPDGLGRRLLEALSRQLQADYAFKRNGGTDFELSFRLAEPQRPE
jgi:two-component sensor histidine kinase